MDLRATTHALHAGLPVSLPVNTRLPLSVVPAVGEQ